MKIVVSLFILVITCNINAQDKAIVFQNLVVNIPENESYSLKRISSLITKNHQTENQKLMAIFKFITQNYSYDYELQKQIENGTYLDQSDEDKLENVLKTKKGVCDNFSILFHELAKRQNIKSKIIIGIAKDNQKMIIGSHAWNAVFVDNKWLIIDVTWGINNPKFVTEYYLLSPEKAIKDHYPYDYIWQFTNTPISAEDFISSNQNSTKRKISSDILIKNHDKMDTVSQYLSTLERIEESGIKNKLISNHYEFVMNMLLSYKLRKSTDSLMLSYENYRLYVKKFNQNKERIKDVKSELQTMIYPINRDLDQLLISINNLKKYNSQFHKSTILNIEQGILKLKDVLRQSNDKLSKY